MRRLVKPIEWSRPVSQRETLDLLPPLEDLDEGCQCRPCHLHFDTFAEYLAHARQHGKG
jgi:hypothetical protein